MTSEDRWERRAVQELAAELRAARVALCSAVLDDRGGGAPEAIERLLDARASQFSEVDRLSGELRTLDPPTAAAIHVTIRALSRLAERR